VEKGVPDFSFPIGREVREELSGRKAKHQAENGVFQRNNFIIHSCSNMKRLLDREGGHLGGRESSVF